MKKLVLALTAVAAFAGSASAADLGARPYTKAPMAVAPAYNWTGFYIFGGAGGGVWDADSHTDVLGVPNTISQNVGGDGWFGTVGIGYDWQFGGGWVAGIFGDGQFGSLKGTVNDQVALLTGRIKMEDAWAGGVRLGYLIAPNVLSYVNGGYSGSQWSGTTLTNFAGTASGFHTDSFNRNGWFVGGGVENNLNIFGIQSPGWFMKTEYRSAFYDAKTQPILLDAGNVPTIHSVRANSWNQTVSTSLVYRFNWTGPVVAKY